MKILPLVLFRRIRALLNSCVLVVELYEYNLIC